MGLEDSIQADNGKKRIEDPIGGASSTVITCSICLEHVSIGGDRSTANLQCGHQFHLGNERSGEDFLFPFRFFSFLFGGFQVNSNLLLEDFA